MGVPEADLTRFLSQRTPRSLTASVREGCLPSRPWLIAIGALAGSIVLAVVLAAAHFPVGFVDDIRLSIGTNAITGGTLLGTAPTDRVVSHPDDHSRRLAVRRLDFRFTTIDGSPAEGSSFARGEVNPNDPIEVEYLLSDPSIARVRGTTRAIASKTGLLALLIPIPAGIVVTVLYLRRKRIEKLLTNGVNTRARLVDVVRSTSTLGAKRLCVALSFRDGRSAVVELPRDRVDTNAILARAAASELVPVLRDLFRPQRLLLIDCIRDNPTVPLQIEEGMDEFGRTLHRRPAPAPVRDSAVH
ncbi:MAG: hypothetical protein AB7I19_12565 [Planctomycetota bacterium]